MKVNPERACVLVVLLLGVALLAGCQTARRSQSWKPWTQTAEGAHQEGLRDAAVENGWAGPP